ncbi:uncharacterized protein Gasu_06990 [Galdieria sulphuraria]|uniref:Uncharacterized protein n=1 Tax=Galdieria sulphuraria TaxID=130081 RepID=M2W8U7_GALSU|nr:uncharacterized protein Gasu_06990 [Galdieria sulphuraria]EME32291.1 hypothetical protein Gasu_06990 [Galdieria sulphuraria]|eukprot:XP_005708811.1 hypothetical protein Gasu_06990 [Galdieria sulphuraria]
MTISHEQLRKLQLDFNEVLYSLFDCFVNSTVILIQRHRRAPSELVICDQPFPQSETVGYGSLINEADIFSCYIPFGEYDPFLSVTYTQQNIAF